MIEIMPLLLLGVVLTIYGLVLLAKEDECRGCPPHKWENALDGLRCLKCHRKPGEVARHFTGDHLGGGLL